MAITLSTITLDDCTFTRLGLGSPRHDDDDDDDDDDCGCGTVRVFNSLSFLS
jgi:hypothetical protein